MKAIILAAGKGTRMEQTTPKGMLMLKRETLIQRQIRLLKELKTDPIVIVTGYESEKIKYPEIIYYNNPYYASTNMIETLMCAKKELNSDILISYSDIIYKKKVLKTVIEHPGDVVVAVDAAWRHYWVLRFKTTEEDLESLSVSSNGKITEIGKPLKTSRGLHYRYVGLIKFSKKGILASLKIYNKRKTKKEPWDQSGKSFEQGYMTDLLQELIVQGTRVSSVVIQGGWLEIDTKKDYKLALSLMDKYEFD